MLNDINLEQVLFLDIETVPEVSEFDALGEAFKNFWEKKSAYFRKSDESAADVYSRAGIYAEFGKIICISVGVIFSRNGAMRLRLKSFYGEKEEELLNGFADMLRRYDGTSQLLCAHNGKEFDFPFIARRMLVSGISIPALLDVAGKKPWETHFLDTLELWKFGDYKHYTSLDLLAHLFNIPTPKDDIDGSMVADVYWKNKDLSRIVEYCQKDVVAIVQLLLRYKGLELIASENIEVAD